MRSRTHSCSQHNPAYGSLLVLDPDGPGILWASASFEGITGRTPVELLRLVDAALRDWHAPGTQNYRFWLHNPDLDMAAYVHQSGIIVEFERLGRLLLRLFPEEPEIMGLTALMLLQHSRAAARFDDVGAIVLLEDQDRRLWDRTAIAEGVALTNRAFRLHRPGPYQLQAAIGALHASAPSFEATDWIQIEQLYGVLFRLQPTPVIALNHAVAISHVRGPEAALALVETLANSLASYFYFHGVRGYLLERLGRERDAREAYRVSLSLANSAAEAAQIRSYLDRLR